MIEKFKMENGKLIGETLPSRLMEVKKTLDAKKAPAPEPIKEIEIKPTKLEIETYIPKVGYKITDCKAGSANSYFNSDGGMKDNPNAPVSHGFRAKMKELESKVRYSSVFDDNADVKSDVYHLAKESYYLAYENGQCLFLNKKQGRGALKLVITVLKKPSNGNFAAGANCIKMKAKCNDGSDLTKADFNDIIKCKPSVPELLSSFDQYHLDTEVTFNTSKAINVF